MSSMQFVIQPLPGTDEQFIERLREVSDKVNKFGFGTHRIFEQLKIPVKEIVSGPNHIGVLLEDGKVFRVAFAINSERLDLTKSDANKCSTNTNAAASNNSKTAVPSSARQLSRSRARLMRTTGRTGSSSQGSGSRSTGVIIGSSSSSRPLVTVPATYVPDELISQAEVVLQGKSRNLIIRELQRTNLDVNLAVNNLLSRDDEEAEDTEEGGDNYVPEDLISLLDNGFHSENNSVIIDPADGLFSEEIFSNYSSIRNLLFDRIRSERNHSNAPNADGNLGRSTTAASSVLAGASGSLGAQISAVSADREAFSRWRDRQYYGPRRWLSKDDYVWDKDQESKRKEPSLASPIWISEELQPWPHKGAPMRFKKIAALYTEFIALSESGELHQWKWNETEPYKSEVDNVHHPKTLTLNLSDKVEHISANFIRCSVVTENNRVATWMDEQLGYLGAKLEHPAIAFNDIVVDSIVSVHVCSLYSAIRTENNHVYWWGVLPFDQRRHLWDKFRSKTKKPCKSVPSDITVGTQVIMKKCPIYQSGSIGFTCANGVPKVGQLLNSVWDFSDVCRFKILNTINVTPDKSSSSSGSGAGAGGGGGSVVVGIGSGSVCSGSSSGGGGVSGSTSLLLSGDKDATKVIISSASVTQLASGSGKSITPANVNKESTDRIDMPPPPSPASSTCSDTGSVTSHKRVKRLTTKDDSDSKNGEELWQLRDVIFVEDKIGPIGRVLKVDGDFVAVRFPMPMAGCVPPPPPPNTTGGGGVANAGGVGEGKGEDDWQQCRLLRREDVQVFKTAMTSRGPDWLQKLPKKININHGCDPASFQLLALAVDMRGIHIIKKGGSKLHYSLYNLYNSKQEQNCQFPTDSGSFFGASLANISMTCNNDCSGNTSTIVLRDGNRALYPLAKDCIGSIKDPQWLDLPPVKAVSMTTISLPAVGNNLKSKVCMTALLFDAQKLMPHILRCDIKNAVATLNRLEKEDRHDLSAIIDERCDGSRNIFHACTVMCSPSSNKDSDEKKATVLPCLSSRAAATGPPTTSSGSATTGFASGGSGSGSNNTAAPTSMDGANNLANPSTSTFATMSTNTSAMAAAAPPPSSSSLSSVGSSSVTASREGRTVSLREMMNRLINNDPAEMSNANANAPQAPQASGVLSNVEDHSYVPTWSIESSSNSSTSGMADVGLMSGAEDDISKIIALTASAPDKLSPPSYSFDATQRREHAILILQQMCSNVSLRPHLTLMLSAKDAQGQTPFMLAVYSRAYEAGIILLNTILTLADKDAALRDSMVFPAGSPPDQSPLHVICYNDTCSFTWTGADHINQNIFECKTCGLTGSLCCCTECARVCHKGHDCKLKRTSPTAYCDCWEKCKCKALIAGNQNRRFALLCKLASCTDLVTKFNSKGETILLFLIQTVGRQTAEQRQYRANNRVRNVTSSGSGATPSRKSSSSIDLEADMPDHDLEPPKFARKALERLLVDWNAVRSMMLTGAEKTENLTGQAGGSSSTQHNGGNGDGNTSESYNIYLQTQNGSTLLDKFTHNLFVKCSSEHLDTLVMTLVRELQNSSVDGRIAEAELVARRFVRSVARVFVIFNLEKLPNPERRKSNVTTNKHIQSCIKVFQTLQKISIQELCEISESLIAPVRLGVVRPTAPFAMSSTNLDNSDDLFSVEPLAPSSVSEAVVEPVVAHEAAHEQQAGFNLQTNYPIDSIESVLRDASETDDNGVNRENNVHMQDEDIIETGRNDDGIQDDESDNDFTFNDAETESDSDDNQSNQDAQRSVQTGATVGSETDESGDSSPQDEDASDDGESDHSDEFNFADHQLERRNANSANRSDLAPQSMQWAIRSRENARSVRVPAGSSLVFIDPMALRRSTVPTSSAVASPQEQHTMATTASNLARAFSIVVRQISELMSNMVYNITNEVDVMLRVHSEEAIELQTFVETRLRATWDWMFSVLDGTESQLKFGAYLTNYTDPTHPLHPLNLSTQSSNNTTPASTSSSSVGINLMSSSSRREFFTYCLSLMRAHTFEHRDALPVLDITAMRHIAYVLDGFIFYLRNDTHFFERSDIMSKNSTAMNVNENDDTDEELSNITSDDTFNEHNVNSQQAATSAGTSAAAGGAPTTATTSSRRHSFFTRSESTLSLGFLAPDGFELPLDVAIPLADKPHLLQPNSKREDLFANMPLLLAKCDSSANENGMQINTKDMMTTSSIDVPPTKLAFSNYVQAPSSSSAMPASSATVASMASDLVSVPMETASTSSYAQSKLKRSEPDSDTNVYLQIKKKQYLDDSKNSSASTSSSVASPTKLSISLNRTDCGARVFQTNAGGTADIAMTNMDEASSATAKSAFNSKCEQGLSGMSTRPEVIIAPNKIAKTDEMPTIGGGGGGGDASKILSKPIVRSVIVRAGVIAKKPEESGCAAKPPHSESDGKARNRFKSSPFNFPLRGLQFCKSLSSQSPLWNVLLGRWKLTLDLFGRVFMDDVGMEPGSVLPEVRGFPVKETRFRRHMEKLRNGQQRDLILCKLERNRDSLIIQTFKELNTQFGSQNRRVHPPLTFNRVKVTFKDEPGEGSGVARSFYTSISEALLASAKMPNLESIQVGGNSKYCVPFLSTLRNRGTPNRDPPSMQRRGTGSKILWRTARERKVLNFEARPYIPSTDNAADNANDHLSVHLQQLGERLHPKIYSINPSHASKITGMLLEIPTPQLLSILSSEETLRQKVNEALEIIAFKQKSMDGSGNTTTSTSSSSSSAVQSKKIPVVLLEQCNVEDNEPLFYSPGKRGFYTPRQGYGSFERINAFRNIGRLIGLCLLQNELLPLFLQRHVLKYILGRKIKFHDLAFFDPAIYESFRQLIQNAQATNGEDIISRMELYFVIDLLKEEGGGNVELIPGGREVQVTCSNLFEYIRRYTEYRLIKSQEKALEALKDGVFDVLPDTCMNSLTAEDLRLLLNGVGDINVSTLISYTTFNDESSEGSDKLLKFKRWFWSIVEKMNTLERQDLVYFWTGSPALPASEEGFQPLPSVTIRPADDSHLPTANTCISRLYIPLYSSKSILRSKLLLAIKSKNFGFV